MGKQYEARTILTPHSSETVGPAISLAGFKISLSGPVPLCSVSFSRGRCSSYCRFVITFCGTTKRTALIQWTIQPIKFDYLRAVMPSVLSSFLNSCHSFTSNLTTQDPDFPVKPKPKPNTNTMSQPYFFCAVMRNQTSNATVNQKSQPYFFCSVQKSQPYFFCSVQKSK